MARPDRCTCGRVPVIRARATQDGGVITQVTCASHECGAQGLPVEDVERNDEAAVLQWNRVGGRKAA